MKVITLNTWGGRITKELIDFFAKHKGTTDVFCLQEVYHRATHIHVEQGGIDPNLTLLDDIKEVLPDYLGYFRPHYLETYGLATLVKNDLIVTAENEFFVHRHKGFVPRDIILNHARNVQVTSIRQGTEDFHVFNFHGLWCGEGKRDSEPRLEQSRKLVEYLKQFEGKKVICGDFNLLPDTASLGMIEGIPLRNLVKEYSITSTRTSYYKKELRLADYILVSDTVEVIDFRVLPDEVSDHSPLVSELQ